MQLSIRPIIVIPLWLRRQCLVPLVVAYLNQVASVARREVGQAWTVSLQRNAVPTTPASIAPTCASVTKSH